MTHGPVRAGETTSVSFEDVVGLVGKVLDAAGVVILAVGAAAALGWLAVRSVQGHMRDAYRPTRQFLGKVILLGLEVLVAADIIRTVAIEPTLTSVAP